MTKEIKRIGAVCVLILAGATCLGSVSGASENYADKLAWAMLMHLGNHSKKEKSLVCDEKVWKEITANFAACGGNMLVIDLENGMEFPSHPELAIEGAWSAEKVKAEVKRLREMGVEAIPKLNFSSAHSWWLGDYRRMTSTPEYYKVVSELIGDVVEIFGRPRFVHIGMDEESYENRNLMGDFDVVILRQGDLFYHDVDYIASEVRKHGARAWIWSDKEWYDPGNFCKKVSKDIVQSHWYYSPYFKREGSDFRDHEVVSDLQRSGNYNLCVIGELDRAGFCQMPCGSNWYDHYNNFYDLVEHSLRTCSRERLLGFIIAPWIKTRVGQWGSDRSKLIASCGQVASAKAFARGFFANYDRYVPEPKPVKTDIEVHAFYYPGTDQRQEWDMVAETLPEIKPLLGWYDEGDPEVVDWQIKWAVEHGISAFAVDWYWHKGVQRLDHWLKAYYKARYSRYLKWYLMYANHNDPGAHSIADTKRFARFWLDNFFHTSQYYKIDGKPLVMLWSPYNLGRDLAAELTAKGTKASVAEGLKLGLKIIEDAARAEGLPGVVFSGRYYDKETEDLYAACGIVNEFDYGYDKEASKEKTFDYSLVQSGVRKWWNEKCTGTRISRWPIVPTGWDDRPRSYQTPRCVITGRTPEKFKKMLEDCKAFCSRHGHRRVIIAPLNEWQEGSYIEPNEEYGFGMYDAIRDVFAEKPQEGWPKNLVPKDVGLGPYDYPSVHRLGDLEWTFDNSKYRDNNPEGWYRSPYGTASIRVEDGKLKFSRAYGPYTAIRTDVVPFDAGEYGKFKVRMKLNVRERSLLPAWAKEIVPKGTIRWGSDENPLVVSGGKAGEVRVRMEPCVEFDPIGDGEWHEYSIDLSSSPEWKGRVSEIWFDPHPVIYTEVEIDWIKICR